MSAGRALRSAEPLALFLVLVLFSSLCLLPGSAEAQVAGSWHDFCSKSNTFAPGGSCSACHREHYAPDEVVEHELRRTFGRRFDAHVWESSAEKIAREL